MLGSFFLKSLRQQGLPSQPNSGAKVSPPITSVPDALAKVNPTAIHSASDAMAALRTLSALQYTSYSTKVDAHSQLIKTLSSNLNTGEKATFNREVTAYYTDNAYLGSQVSAKLPTNQKQAIFGNVAGIKFESTLYDELKRSPISYAPTEQIAAVITAQEAPAPEITLPKAPPQSSSRTRSHSDPILLKPKATATSSIARVTARPVSAEASAKDLYLQGIRTTKMLGNHEMQPLANIIGRPIVVVRQEPSKGTGGYIHPNNVELVVYPVGHPQNLTGAIYVQNIYNGHFRSFTPTLGNPVVPGTELPGTAREGDYGGAGPNDCLIASIKGSGGSFGQLSNRDVRQSCASYQDINGLPDHYIPDAEGGGRIAMFGIETTIPKGFIGPLMIKKSDDVWAQGEYNGGRVGNWEVRNDNGLFAVSYDRDTHEPIQVTQTGEFQRDGRMALLTRPTEFVDIDTALPLISVH